MQLTAPGPSRAASHAVLILLAWTGAAVAHGPRVPFADWGGFSAATARCQRVIAREAAACGATAWQVRSDCRRTELAGEICNTRETEARISAARTRALDAIDVTCSEESLSELSFTGLFDLAADVSDFCRNWERESVSAVYGPFPGAAPSGEQACSEAAAAATEATMRFVFRSRRQCMDRIALLPLETPNRRDLLDTAAHRIAAAQDILAARLGSRCTVEAFIALYGRTPETFVTDIMVRADCLGGRLYIQDAVLCPDATCGNGIIELPETCDDANTADGDACPANCHL